MSTIFIALQCYQCSTMQVKLQKKSSNKWTCVVCNQKQSVRKVFARGFMAKDVRKFVQGFNMSRQFEETQIEIEETPTEGSDDPPPPSDFGSSTSYQRRRNDWAEYLDAKDNQVDQESCGAVSEPEIRTEFPKEMYQKPKLKSSAGLHKTHGNKLFKPIFTKRKEMPIPKPKENTGEDNGQGSVQME